MHGLRPLEVDEDLKVQTVVARVRAALGGEVADDVIEQRVRDTFAEWRDATVRDFIPLLTERRVLEGLRS